MTLKSTSKSTPTMLTAPLLLPPPPPQWRCTSRCALCTRQGEAPSSSSEVRHIPRISKQQNIRCCFTTAFFYWTPFDLRHVVQQWAHTRPDNNNRCRQSLPPSLPTTHPSILSHALSSPSKATSEKRWARLPHSVVAPALP